MLSASELSLMRSVQNEALPDTGTILRGTSTVNEIGEATLSWGTVASSVACRLMPPGRQSGLDVIGDQSNLVANWVVTLAYDKDVVTGDRIVIAGGTYDVIAVTDEFEWRTAVRADCRRLE